MSKERGFVNTRRFPRFDLDTQLNATVAEMEKHRPMHGRSIDINEGGMSGIFAKNCQVGTEVMLEFAVPVPSTIVRIQAVVRNRTDHRYGFEFVNVTSNQRDVIVRTCRNLAMLQ